MGEIKRKFNWVPSPPDPRDKEYRKSFFFARALPSSVDLRSKCSPVADQGELGSCTANALASGFREFELLRAGEPLVRLSRLFVYYEERLAEGDVFNDSGANLRDGLDCLVHLGVCREELDPYNIKQFTTAPSDAAMADAANYKISKYLRVNGINAVKQCLADGNIVVAGMDVYNQFEESATAKTGIVYLPRSGESSIGGHAICVVGYQDTPRYQPGYWKGGGYWWVRNSWGKGWGIDGYFKLSYDYTHLGYMTEFWVGIV